MSKRSAFLGLLLIALAALSLSAQNAAGGAAKACSASSGPGLENALNAMDKAAEGFRSAQVEFVWTQYEAVVQDTSRQAGVMYIRKTNHDIQMAADIREPANEKKYVLYRDNVVQLYQPRINQVTQYSAGNNKDAFQSFLILGFGGRGHDLQKQFGVQYCGAEPAGGVNAFKLQLTPKAPKVRNIFDRILLWIDPERGVSVQQQFFEPLSGNYRLAAYSNIKLNQPLPQGVFKIQTNDKTKVVKPGM